MQLAVQFVDFFVGLVEGLMAGGGDAVDAAAATGDDLFRGVQEAGGFQAVEERIEGSGADAVAVMGEFVHHGESKDGLVGRVDQHMNPDKAVEKLALRVRHRINIPSNSGKSDCLVSVFDICSSSRIRAGRRREQG